MHLHSRARVSCSTPGCFYLSCWFFLSSFFGSELPSPPSQCFFCLEQGKVELGYVFVSLSLKSNLFARWAGAVFQVTLHRTIRACP